MAKHRRYVQRTILSVLFIAFIASSAHAQEFDKVQIKTEKVADGIYMLMGAGGNIGISADADGDAIILFRRNNVVHMGDTYFAGQYPFIDLDAGGSVNGVIDAIKQVLPMMNNATKIIPGHGALSNKSELENYAGMLTTIRDRIRNQIRAGKSSEEVVTSKPTKDLDAEWQKGIIKGDAFAELLYLDLSSK